MLRWCSGIYGFRSYAAIFSGSTGFALISLLFGWNVAVNVFTGMIGIAALAALLGYCDGCILYFQYKQFRAQIMSRD
ncbi:DUF4395 family protein [Paenibacillaceae bacterium WGS1546]|uniref:DUF4395 family protein n=1 Tax=Cohnella sp. WGS1546 TaxID=3366810 RepID=UPI00372D29ED